MSTVTTAWKKTKHSAAAIRKSKREARERAEAQARDLRLRTCRCEKPTKSRCYLGWFLCALCQRLIHPEREV